MNKKRCTAFQILLDAFNGNMKLVSELFLSKGQNNIQASSGKEFNISKKEKKWFLFCASIVNLSYVFLWETFADEYQIINNNNNIISIYHLFFAFSLIVLVFSSLLFLHECDFE